MAASSIQVHSTTRKMLAEYRTDGLTYDDVLKILMAIVPAKDFSRMYKEVQERLWEQVRHEWLTMDQVKQRVHSPIPRKKS